MRVAFIDYTRSPAATDMTAPSDLVWDLACRLARLGDEVHVVAPYGPADAPDPAVRLHTFAAPPAGRGGVLGAGLAALAAIGALRRLGPLDVVHCPDYLAGALAAPLLSPTPVVFHGSGNIFEAIDNGNPHGWATTQALKLAALVSARAGARCIATSDLMAGWWEWTGVSARRLARVHLGVDTAAFRRVAGARRRLGLDPQAPLLLVAAPLTRAGGVEVALRAAARLLPRLPGLQLVVLGDGPEAAGAMRLARELGIEGALVWRGEVPREELPLYYSAADALAYTGFSGGTPAAMLQAMACGTPVVASSIGGVVDHLEEGVTGLLFPAGHDGLLADQLARLLGSGELARRVGAEGQAYVQRHLDWGVLVGPIREVYAGLARKGAQGLGAPGPRPL